MFLYPIIFTFMMHPVHVSLTNIELDKNSNSFDITFKFFKDDFQSIVAIQTHYLINIDNKDYNDEEISAVADYLNKHFSINWFSGKIIDENFIGKEIDDLAVWYYIKLPLNRVEGSLKIRNSLLLDLFSDQTNLVIYSDAKSEVSEIFNKRKIMLEFDVY